LLALPSATRLRAHGTAVGLPSDADMGNSEVGHNALGAGRVFAQGASLVEAALSAGSIWAGDAWRELVARVKHTGEPLHFIGLLSDGNVHAHEDHLFAMLRRAAAEGVARTRVHALLDGRDVPPRSALRYVERLEAVIAELAAAGHECKVASGGGRMVVTMDRYDADWAMVARGWALHVRGEGRRFPSLRAAVEALYGESERGDQDLDGFVIDEGEGAVGPIRDGAGVICFNFRGDRAIELTKAMERDECPWFDRGPRPDVMFAGLMQYDGDLALPARYLVDPPALRGTLGERLARTGKTQLAIAETQKFGHVTYFWNGNRSGCFDTALERYIEVPSDLRPFDERPWMKAAEVTDALLDELARQRWDFVRVNYANGDMVGHTGTLDATIVALEAVDLQLARVWKAVATMGGVLIVTADHGNADDMLQPPTQVGGVAGVRLPKTSHSLNLVPFVVVDPREVEGGPRLVPPATRSDGPGLANVAATICELLGLAAPEAFEPSLLDHA
jgi:2,3-bisphosphoglycerate-independent phosphoglycerate mutase